MKLYLSSHGIGTHVVKLHEMVGADKRVLFIDNAKDELPEAERAVHVEEKRQEFTDAGFDFYELDLRNYFRSPDTLKKLIHNAPFIWVSGGNTFVLRRAFAYSGLDSLLINALRTSDMVYGGSSAGAIIMTSSLKGTELGDDPTVVPTGYKKELIWDGLGLVYPQLVPHFESEWFNKEAQEMADYFKKNNVAYVALKDSEVYVVDGDSEGKLA